MDIFINKLNCRKFMVMENILVFFFLVVVFVIWVNILVFILVFMFKRYNIV